MKKIPEFGKGKGTPSKKDKNAPATPVKVKAKTTGKGAAAMIATAAMLALPQTVVSNRAGAQAAPVKPAASPATPGAAPITLNFAKVETDYHMIKMPGTFTVLGEGDGHTIFKGPDGQMFYLDPNTGDKKSVAVDYFLKLGDIKGSRSAVSTHTGGGGGSGRYVFKDVIITSIVGMDAKGNAIMQNARHETFILDPRTGNQVFIKWPK